MRIYGVTIGNVDPAGSSSASSCAEAERCSQPIAREPLDEEPRVLAVVPPSQDHRVVRRHVFALRFQPLVPRDEVLVLMWPVARYTVGPRGISRSSTRVSSGVDSCCPIARKCARWPAADASTWIAKELREQPASSADAASAACSCGDMRSVTFVAFDPDMARHGRARVRHRHRDDGADAGTDDGTGAVTTSNQPAKRHSIASVPAPRASAAMTSPRRLCLRDLTYRFTIDATGSRRSRSRVDIGQYAPFVAAEPEIRYARSREGLHLTFAELGVGPPYVMRVIGAMTHLRLAIEDPVIGACERRIAAFARIVLMDERGAGMSDPVALADLPTLEQRVDDVLAVLDAAGSNGRHGSASAAGARSRSCSRSPTSIASNRSCCSRRGRASPWPTTIPSGFRRRCMQTFAAAVGEGWGTGSFLDLMGPSVADTPFRERFAQFELSSASPGQAQALVQRGFDHDVRHLLPLVAVPTLVLHRTGDRVVPIALGRYVAEHIPGARMVECPGEDNFPFLGDVDAYTDEIEEFLTGERGYHPTDRVLATVMFTDIVDSTRRASTMGDQKWLALIEEHDALVRRQLDRFGGRAIKSTGDGVLATFDGPARAIACARALREGAARLGVELTVGSAHRRGRVARRRRRHRDRGAHRGARARGRAARPGARVFGRAAARVRLRHRIHRPRSARAQGRPRRVEPLRRRRLRRKRAGDGNRTRVLSLGS